MRSVETLPEDVITAEIRRANRGLFDLPQQISLAIPFDAEAFCQGHILLQSGNIADDETPGSFWTDRIGNPTSAADAVFQSLGKEVPLEKGQRMIDHAQKNALARLAQWRILPQSSATDVGKESTEAFTLAASAFQWSAHNDLFLALKRYGDILGDLSLDNK